MTRARSPITPVRPGSEIQEPVPVPDDVWAATSLTPPPPGSLSTSSPFAPVSYVPPAPAPFDTSSGTPSVTDPDSSEAWNATHLSAPPSGSLSMTPAPWHEVGAGWTPDEVPSVPTGFSPPEERGSLPAAAVPDEMVPTLIVPKPIRGIPVDQPAAGRFAAPEETVQRRRRKLNRPMLVVAAAVVVLAVVIGYVFVDHNRPVAIDPNIVVPSSAQASAPKVARGDLAVKGYLEALQRGDIDAAIAYGPVGGGSRALLVADALKASLAAAPITNIVVATADATASTIRASYQLGTQAVNADYKVVKKDDGNWQLASSTTTVRLEAKRSDRVPLVINGQTIGPVVELELVPGTYAMSTGLAFLQYQSTTKITVNDLSYTKAIAELPIDVTAEGKDALIQAAQTSLANCMSYKGLSPSNCPARETTPRPLNESTINRRLNVPDPVSSAQWIVEKADPALAQAVIQVNYTFNAVFADGGTTDGTVYNKQWTARADATKTRAQDLEILWS